MEDVPILIVGESHSIALARAVAARGEAGRHIEVFDVRPFRPVVTVARGVAAFAPALVTALDEKLRSDRVVVSCIGGNKHNAMSLIAMPQPFDFHLSEDGAPPIDETACLVPEGAIRDSLEHRMARELDAVALLSAKAERPILVLEAPPPVGDERHILARADSQFRDLGVAEQGISPPGLRLKVWLLHRRIVIDHCRRVGATYIPVPDTVRAADGLLHRDGYGADATHGNEWFGEQMLRAVERHLQQRNAASTAPTAIPA